MTHKRVVIALNKQHGLLRREGVNIGQYKLTLNSLDEDQG